MTSTARKSAGFICTPLIASLARSSCDRFSILGTFSGFPRAQRCCPVGVHVYRTYNIHLVFFLEPEFAPQINLIPVAILINIIWMTCSTSTRRKKTKCHHIQQKSSARCSQARVLLRAIGVQRSGIPFLVIIGNVLAYRPEFVKSWDSPSNPLNPLIRCCPQNSYIVLVVRQGAGP
jgi:hypothetical protein